jgi:hypothetical protein
MYKVKILSEKEKQQIQMRHIYNFYMNIFDLEKKKITWSIYTEYEGLIIKEIYFLLLIEDFIRSKKMNYKKQNSL